MRDIGEAVTAFQSNGFQHDAFQAGFITGGEEEAVVIPLRSLMGFGLSLLLGMVLLGL